jgi:predicted dehydrogenase/threonine dehydrogenase-like Zn-dependent dehydrogenase
LVKKVVDSVKKEGLIETMQMVKVGLDTPFPLGYSCAGIVREIGAGVNGFQTGDRVACGGGGYANHAEFNVVPKNLCVKIPHTGKIDEPSFEFDKACFATVGAVALQGVRQANPNLGEKICVIGLGLLGQLTLQICKANGCQVIGADINEERIALAKNLGADESVNSNNLVEAVSHFTEGRGVDSVIITATDNSSKVIELSGEIARFKGTVVAVGLIGLNIPRSIFYSKELDLRLSMSYGPGRYDVNYEERGNDYPYAYVRWTEKRNMAAFLELVQKKYIDIEPLITHRFPFEKSLDAYKLISEDKERALGVVLKYSANEEPRRINLKPKIASSIEPSKLIRIGMIGAGNFARNILLPRLAKIENVDFGGIASGKGINAKKVADQFNFQYCCNSPEEIINDPSINSIFIATRHDLHGALIEKAILAGKHVFAEKPLCISGHELVSIKELTENLSKKSTLPVMMVGFNRRFAPFISKICDIVQRRKTPIVASYHINAGMVSMDSWIQDPAQGGRIIGEVCHFIDTLRFLIGYPVKKIYATCLDSGNENVADKDSIAVSLTYEDGSIATIMYYAIGNSRFPKEYLSIATDMNNFVIDDYRRLTIYTGNKVTKYRSKQNKGHYEELSRFITSVRGPKEVPIPFSELFETTSITFLIHKSLETGSAIHCQL